MKNRISKELVGGSLILIVGFGIFNLFHFLFQFFMARLLDLSQYGLLASLLAITYITSIATESIQTVLAKYSANEDDKGSIKNILKKSMKKAFLPAITFVVIYLIIAIPLSSLLKINYLLLSMNSFIIFFAFFTPIIRGVMQGQKRFYSLGVNLMSEALGKLILGVLLVYIGWKIYGAIAGIIFGVVIAMIIAIIQLRDIIKSDEKKSKTFGIYGYAKPTFFITALVIIFYNMDVLMARFLFAPETAGAYAIASILGKIIFWGTLPISKAMFPLSAKKGSEDYENRKIFSSAFLILIFGIVVALLAFFLFPDFIISFFSGKSVPVASSLLFYLGISFGIVSISNLILLYKLSIDKVKNYKILGIFLVIEVILLYNFSANPVQFALAFMTSSAALLWGIIFLLNEKKD